ncbi:MAG: hypothetical protein A2015_07595 [Spirochaetes bacterium GWF1_31_7]|nr:MAG: hypothetical protein A2Y30_01690 [Spirochaetes bacterium GWE1_32_154]OHD46907.1 MAG: hypothetical protein A2015_07595 [Spirochaetes bacterium GWF1_31_7]OHD48685.1 MAG: hypothetical protein A2Y29_13820 [Spirochaetes bacterium GWE2_31_10]OHD76197.1 MAG: hypothetical protein A2355_06565 [Spirochaetes bacterium RIFOXYB1_FULL_32_8]HBD94911.1 ABC transporter permease [Spirochaetia bacterium]
MDELKTKRGGLGYMIKIAYRNIYRNKRRSVLCMTAIGLAVFFIVFMMGWIMGMYDSVVKTVLTFETGHVQVFTKEYFAKEDFIPVQYPVEFENGSVDEFIDEIGKIPGVKAVLPRIASYTTLTDSKVKHAVLWGLHIQKEFETNVFNLKEKSNGLIKGRYPLENENACAIGRKMAEKMGVTIGDSIPLKAVSSQFSDKFWNPEIVGIFDFDYGSVDTLYIIVPYERLQKILSLRNKAQKIILYLDNPEDSEIVKSAITELIAKKGNSDVIVKKWQEHQFIDMFKQMASIYVIVFLVFIIVASFLIVNTVLMMIHERIKEIGMMGALGMTRLEIMSVFFFEAVLLSILGSFFGILVGGVVSYAMSLYPIDVVSLSGGMEMSISNTIFVKFSWLYLLLSFIFGVFVSSVCTLFPSMKSAFIEPVEALRN